MNDHLNYSEGRDIPKARKSIHDHEGHCLVRDCEAMGRYGVEKSLLDAPGVCHEQGRDEVDNIFSKPRRSPDPFTNKQNKRKTSSPNQRYTDDEDECEALAKSLPAYLPSYYREEFGNRKNRTEKITKNPTSFTTEFTAHNLSSNTTDDSFNSSNYSNYSSLTREFDQSSSEKTNIFIYIAVVFIVALIGVAMSYLVGTQVSGHGSNTSNYNEEKFYQDMDILGGEYKIRDTSMLQLKTGLSSISEREDTGSFIFLYNSRKKGFNKSKFNNFVESVAATAARYLRNNSDKAKARHVIVDNLNMQTHSELIKKYRYDLEKQGVMLLKDVDKVPSKLAMAFHFYCDEYNPLAKKSAVFLTLDLGRCSDIFEHKSSTAKHEDVENCLIKKWDGVPKDNIMPLVTRVVNILIDVSSVF